jgi:hypothetical protein
MTRRIIIIASAALLLGYLVCTRGLWLSELEKQTAIGRDRLSKPVAIEKTGKIVWRIAEEEWKYTGEIQVALVFDNIQTIPRSAYHIDSMALKVAMDANAIIYEQTNTGKKDVFRTNRIIKNWYFTTNQPLSPEARIWQTGGSDIIEIGLCGVTRYPFEDTIIEMEILQPDSTLNKTNPRLIAYGKHDYAIYEHIGGLKVFRDVILSLLALCIIVLAYYATRSKPNKSQERTE